MKKIRLQLALAILGIVALFAILGWAGRRDFNDQVLLHMSQEDYDSIVTTLSFHGQQPSDNDIVQYYIKNYQ